MTPTNIMDELYATISQVLNEAESVPMSTSMSMYLGENFKKDIWGKLHTIYWGGASHSDVFQFHLECRSILGVTILLFGSSLWVSSGKSLDFYSIHKGFEIFRKSTKRACS